MEHMYNVPCFAGDASNLEANNPMSSGGGGGTANGPVSPSISFWFRLNRIILRLCSTHQFKNLQVSYLRSQLSVKSFGKQVQSYPQRPSFLGQLFCSLCNLACSTFFSRNNRNSISKIGNVSLKTEKLNFVV